MRKSKNGKNEFQSSEDDDLENEPRSCSCGAGIESSLLKCMKCEKLGGDEVVEDIVEAVEVKDDESAAWMDPELFPEGNCDCNQDKGEICKNCSKVRKIENSKKDICIQADLNVTIDPSSNLENSIHLCEGESCVCCEGDDTMPHDKSVQVSEILLEQAGTFTDNENIQPESETNLQSEANPKMQENCPICQTPLTLSEGGNVCPKCQENQASIVPRSPHQNGKTKDDFQKASNPDLKSSFPDGLDETSNYTDRETDVQTRLTDGTAAETDSLANAARVRQGNRNDTTEVLKMNI